jgi:hypothetical protein
MVLNSRPGPAFLIFRPALVNTGRLFCVGNYQVFLLYRERISGRSRRESMQ